MLALETDYFCKKPFILAVFGRALDIFFASKNCKIKLLYKNVRQNCHNSGETKNQVVTTNPFTLKFLQRVKGSCTHFQAISFFCKSTKKYTFINVKTPWQKIIKYN